MTQRITPSPIKNLIDFQQLQSNTNQRQIYQSPGNHISYALTPPNQSLITNLITFKSSDTQPTADIETIEHPDDANINEDEDKTADEQEPEGDDAMDKEMNAENTDETVSQPASHWFLL